MAGLCTLKNQNNFSMISERTSFFSSDIKFHSNEAWGVNLKPHESQNYILKSEVISKSNTLKKGMIKRV